MESGVFVGREVLLGAFAADASCELEIFWHDCDSFGVDGAEVGILIQRDEVRFGGFLQRDERTTLEAQVVLKVLRDLAHQPLERQLSDQQLRRLLELADVAQRHRSRSNTKTTQKGVRNQKNGEMSLPVAVWFLDAAGGWGGFAGSLLCELLSRSLAANRLTRGLLRSGHQ